MAVIQFRSGAYADYDPTKMHAAEPAVVLSGDPDTEDGKSVRVGFGSGVDKRLLTEDDAFHVDDELSSLSENPVQNKVINTALNAKAPKASPTFTGTPKAPTASVSTNNTQIATTKFVHDVANTKTRIWYGTCSTTGNTKDKVVTVSDSSFAVADGALLIVNFTNTNTATGLTMNVNNTGAVKVYTFGSSGIKARLRNRAPALFIYVADSTPYWELVDVCMPLKTESATNGAGIISTVSGKYYAVRFDSVGDLCVNVPWADTHGTLTATDQGSGVVALSIS